MLRAASRKDEEILREADELRHEGERTGAEMLPHTVALEHGMEALERDVETHYADLRRILRRAYDERGLAPLQAPLTAPPATLRRCRRRRRRTRARTAPPRPCRKRLCQNCRRCPNAVRGGLAAAAAQIRRKQLAAAFDTLNGLLGDADRLNGRELGEIYSLLAIAHFDNGDVDASAAAFEAVARYADMLSRERLVTTYYNLTGVYVRAKNYPAAAKYMHRAVAESRMLSMACATVCGIAPAGRRPPGALAQRQSASADTPARGPSATARQDRRRGGGSRSSRPDPQLRARASAAPPQPNRTRVPARWLGRPVLAPRRVRPRQRVAGAGRRPHRRHTARERHGSAVPSCAAVLRGGQTTSSPCNTRNAGWRDRI